MNKSNIYTRPKKYGGYVKIDDAMYKKLGLGDWLKNNAGDLLTTVAGGVLTATGAGAAIGGPLMAKGAAGLAENEINRQNTLDQTADNKQQTNITNLNNRLQTEYMEKGGVINYNKGSKHSDPMGGIPVDQMGNPAKGPTAAIVEKGEKTFVFPDGQALVLSEKLGDVKKFDKIRKAYKMRLGDDLMGHDVISRGGFMKEMNDIAAEITARNAPKEITPLKHEGGNIPPHTHDNPMDIYNIPSPFGNLNNKKDINVPFSPLDPLAQSMNPNMNNVSYPSNGPVDLSGYKGKSGSSGYKSPVITEIDNSYKADLNYDKNIINDINNETLDNFSQGMSKNTITPINPSDSNPVGDLYNPVKGAAITAGIGGAANILGNLAMAKLYKKPEQVKANLINAPTISYEAERVAASNDATTKLNSGLSVLRNTGLSRGAYLANATGLTTGVQKNLSDVKSRSYQTEENTNKQLGLSTQEFNAQSKSQAGQFNAYRKDQYDVNKLQFYQGALGAIPGVTNDISQANNMKNYLGINASRTGYEVRKNPVTGKLEMVPVKGYFERMNKVK